MMPGRRRAVDRRYSRCCRHPDLGVHARVAAPSVKQRLAALRHLLAWLANGTVVPVNPARTVSGGDFLTDGKNAQFAAR